jgi:hypothetical protein
MRHHFVPRVGCRRRSRLGKFAIAAPTLDGIAVVRAQGLTRVIVHPEIRRTSRSHFAVMHALGVSLLLTCPRDPSSRCRSRSHLTVVRTSRGRCRVHLKETLSRSCPPDPPPRPLPPRRRAHLMGPPPRACPCIGIRCRSRSHLVVVRASRGPSRAGLRDSPPRACPPDPPSRACSQDPPPRAPLDGGGVIVGVAKTEL